MSIPVFRKGTWVTYPLPPQQDALWNETHLLRAASFFATALSQGVSSEESAFLAECFVNKEVYPDLSYTNKIERKLQTIMSRAETA
jgi:hypothetical protein